MPDRVRQGLGVLNRAGRQMLRYARVPDNSGLTDLTVLVSLPRPDVSMVLDAVAAEISSQED